MFKKGIAAAGCLAVVAAGWSYAATTWQLQTKLSNAGGTIQVRDKALQTKAGSVAYNNFTTSALIPVTVSAVPGYKISSVKKGTIAQTISDDQLFTINVAKTGGSTQSVVASFTANQYLINGAVVGAGSISPASATVSYGGTVIFSANASNGSTVLTGVSAGTVKDLGGNAVTLPYAGPVKITLSPVQSAQTVTATYTTVSVSAGSDKVVALGAAATIYGSVSAGDTISWTQVSGPAAVDTSAWTTATPSFTPPAAGTYVFQATEGLAGQTDLVEITATSDVVAYMQSSCDGCHNATTGVAPSTAFNKWQTSAHAASSVSCVTCHTEGAMPTPVNTATVDANTFKVLNASAGTVGTSYCAKCHTGSLNNHAAADAKCSTCHNVHNPAVEVTALADDFVGSAACGVCHANNYATFVNSGHNFKMNKVEGGTYPRYPFSNISGALENMPATSTTNALGKPTNYSQVTYVVGGYGWKARWFDANGYLVTSGTQGVQYNLAYPATNQTIGQGWDVYGGTNKPYNCGECHTTGWKYVGPTGAAAGLGQDGLPGMQGTWVESGVSCEACHGAGKAHAGAPTAANIVKNATARTVEQVRHEEGYGLAITCAECHTRDGERNIYNGEGSKNFWSAYAVWANITSNATSNVTGGRMPAGGGLSKHHQTGDELKGIDPDAVGADRLVGLGKHLKAGVNCGTCHNPHRTTKFQGISGDGLGVDVDCLSCHTVTFNTTAHGGNTNADCIKCHMPYLNKSAVQNGTNYAGVKVGDMRTHIFKIDLTKTAQFNAAGTFVKPWLVKEYACGTCHGTASNAPGVTTGIAAITANTRVHGTVAFNHNNATYAQQQGVVPENGAACATCHKAGQAPAVPVIADDYVGSTTCASCHASNYATFVRSGHNFKMNKVVGGVAPVYPFSNITGALSRMPATTTTNALGKPTAWNQTTYVVGGYGWKARWFDADGFLVTSGTQGVQYNLADGSWSTYGGTNKPYNCGECHVTGWKYVGATGAAAGLGQDGLPGMQGTWTESGVACESCHGAGREHSATSDPTKIVKVATGRTIEEVRNEEGYGLAVSCRECHTRDGERNVYGGEGSSNFQSAFNRTTGDDTIIGGRIRNFGHHEAGDELLGVLPVAYDMGSGIVATNTIVGQHIPAGVSCGTCHNPHKTTRYQAISGDGPGADKSCTDCHSAKANFTVAAHTGLACISCHMPKLSKSAINTTTPGAATGKNLAGVSQGDMKVHIFKIRLDLAAQSASAPQYPGGPSMAFTMPWITKEYACGSCHADVATKVGALPGGTVH